MKLIKKMLSVFLCLTVIIGSLSVGLFSVSAATVKGNRGADGKGFIYKKTAIKAVFLINQVCCSIQRLMIH